MKHRIVQKVSDFEIIPNTINGRKEVIITLGSAKLGFPTDETDIKNLNLILEYETPDAQP